MTNTPTIELDKDALAAAQRAYPGFRIHHERLRMALRAYLAALPRAAPPAPGSEYDDLIFLLNGRPARPGSDYTDPLCEEAVGAIEDLQTRLAAALSTAPSAVEPGWIKWEGGEQPVDAVVEYMLRASNPHRQNRAGPFTRHSAALRWNHDGNWDDIIAYRVVPSPGDG